RTEQQAALDEDIEMRDADQHDKPSLPLSSQDVAGVAAGGVAGGAVASGIALGVEESRRRDSRDSSQGEPTQTLPPPPPGPPPQTQQHDVAGGNDTTTLSSAASERDETQKWLLPPIKPEHRGRKCLVLDLDETLVHSSFKILHQADFTIPVEIEGQYHNVYVIKRPGVDAFLKRVGEIYEV
ncbi:hypothetical protein KC343_g23488, partial [Hortaea werneckii]